MTPQFVAPLTVINCAPRGVNYAPRVVHYALREKIYSTGVAQDYCHMTNNHKMPLLLNIIDESFKIKKSRNKENDLPRIFKT